jgi:CRISPR-associated protein Csx17
MTMHLHILKGCAPAPLANYLKALGILRLVGEQADPQARGWWVGERFCLLTKLSKEELETFFLEKYEPTPLIAPWNAGSGFYSTWDAEKKKLRNSKNAAALDELLEKGGDRVQALRAAVDDIRQNLGKYCRRVDVSKLEKKQLGKLLIISEGDGPVFRVIPKDDSGKAKVQRVLVRFSRKTPFYRSALVETEEKIKYPWMWGSGGNDGGIDYTGRFFENLSLVLIPKDTKLNAALLQNALFAEHSTGYLSKAAGKVGQFFPTGAGGANITTGTGSQHDTHLNPWDYIFLLEGAVLFSSRATRTLDPNAMARASAPFAVHAHAAGFATPGSEKAQRGEQWMPLWSQPATLADLATLLGEARIQLDRQPANRPVDAARAISRLGVARGIEAFVRYGYLERNGQSTLAVPLGRVQVRHHPRTYLIDDLAAWMDRVQRCSRDKNAPARLVHAERRLADAVFAALTHDYSADRWQAILLAAAKIDAMQATGTGIEAGVLHGLKPEWVDAVNDNSPEFRLALALGSAAANYSKGKPVDPIRYHVLPLDEKNPRRFDIKEKKLVNSPRVVVSGRDPLRDLAAIVERRLIEAAQQGQRRSRLVAAAGCGARFDDLARFLSGAVDLDRLFGLARAFMALDWRKWDSKQHLPRFEGSTFPEMPDECWLAVRLCCLPFAIDELHDIPADERMVRLLNAGDAARAIKIACQRLQSVGIRPPMVAGTTDAETARRWAAALAFPIHRITAQRAMIQLDPSKKGLIHA